MMQSAQISTIASAKYASLLLITLLAACGCRSVDNAQLDLLERELRQQEAYIYELEDYLVEYSEKLRQCRCTNELHLHAAPGDSSESALQTPADSTAVPAAEIPEPELADDSPLEDEGPVPELADEPLPEPEGANTESADPPRGGGPEKNEPEAIDPESIDIESLEDPGLEIGPTSALPNSDDARLVAEDHADAYSNNDAHATEYQQQEAFDRAESKQEIMTVDSERRMPEKLVIRQILADDAVAEASGSNQAPFSNDRYTISIPENICRPFFEIWIFQFLPRSR